MQRSALLKPPTLPLRRWQLVCDRQERHHQQTGCDADWQLAFNYAEGIKGFNSQKGLFDVTVEGDTTATAFKLTSKLVSNTLTQLDTSGSTLEVGVNYNGAVVGKTAETTMIDTTAGILGGNLSALSNVYNRAGRTSAQDQFTFSIIGATSNGTTAVTDFSTLPEGIWSGDVSVEFNATRTS